MQQIDKSSVRHLTELPMGSQLTEPCGCVWTKCNPPRGHKSMVHHPWFKLRHCGCHERASVLKEGAKGYRCLPPGYLVDAVKIEVPV